MSIFSETMTWVMTKAKPFIYESKSVIALQRKYHCNYRSS